MGTRWRDRQCQAVARRMYQGSDMASLHTFLSSEQPLLNLLFHRIQGGRADNQGVSDMESGHAAPSGCLLPGGPGGQGAERSPCAWELPNPVILGACPWATEPKSQPQEDRPVAGVGLLPLRTASHWPSFGHLVYSQMLVWRLLKGWSAGEAGKSTEMAAQGLPSRHPDAQSPALPP